MDNPQLEIVRQSAHTLLSCDDDFALMKKSVDDLYRIFSVLTGVTIHQVNEDEDILLPTGKAISRSAAAHCLLELKRTAVFLRGINKAVSLKLQEVNDKPISILYAGTGPYGTLVIPLLTLYKPAELMVDLLDINSDSLDALQKVTNCLELNPYIDNVYCTDATTFIVSKHYDIVISETMLACLKSEPQVAIMQNMIPQMGNSAIFIPEDISIDAWLTNPRMEQERMLFYEGEKPHFERVYLGNIFSVNRFNLATDQFRKTLRIPENWEPFNVLKLFTTVRVFEDELLKENDSSITMPQKVCDLYVRVINSFDCWYEQGEKPGMRWEYIEEAELEEVK
jgi:hypothetical protein